MGAYITSTGNRVAVTIATKLGGHVVGNSGRQAGLQNFALPPLNSRLDAHALRLDAVRFFILGDFSPLSRLKGRVH